MDIIAKLPAMEDSALAVLRDNAARLEQSGTKVQRTQAAELLPALDSELASRREAKLQSAREKRAATKRKS